MKDLTVFILTHDRPALLMETLRSVCKQSCYDFRIVVSDNSENDDTEKKIKKSAYLNRIQYIRREEEFDGVTHFITVLREIETKYFVLFHDDDIMMCSFVEKLYDTIVQTSCAAVACNAKRLLDDRFTDKVINSMKSDKIIGSADDLFYAYKKGEINPFPGYMYCTDYIKEMDQSFGAGKYSDVVFLLKLLEKGRILWLSDPLMYYRIHADQDSQQYDFFSKLKLASEFSVRLQKAETYMDLIDYLILQIYYHAVIDSDQKSMDYLKKSGNRKYYRKALIRKYISNVSFINNICRKRRIVGIK